MNLLLAVSTVEEPKSYKLVKIIGRDRENLNKFQADVTGYTLAGVIWRSSNEVWKTRWGL
jgi:hypothetical protein